MNYRPFEDREMLSGYNLNVIDDLVADLDRILDGMFHDGIDAMGDDA